MQVLSRPTCLLRSLHKVTGARVYIICCGAPASSVRLARRCCRSAVWPLRPADAPPAAARCRALPPLTPASQLLPGVLGAQQDSLVCIACWLCAASCSSPLESHNHHWRGKPPYLKFELPDSSGVAEVSTTILLGYTCAAAGGAIAARKGSCSTMLDRSGWTKNRSLHSRCVAFRATVI